MDRNWTDNGFPVWFDGKSVNEALFCEEYLKFHKLIFTNGVFFTPDGRITDEFFGIEVVEGIDKREVYDSSQRTYIHRK